MELNLILSHFLSVIMYCSQELDRCPRLGAIGSELVGMALVNTRTQAEQELLESVFLPHFRQ
jgi:hypothetical protein